MIFHHNFSPLLFNIGPVEVRWYGALFALGIVLAYSVMAWGFRRQGHRMEHLESLVVYLFIGLVVGARLGHIFFYNPEFFLSEPIRILKIWEGGLASHGAAIGVALAVWLWSWKHKVKFSKYVAELAIGMPLLAGFVRIGNFMNSEIVGYATNGNWGVVFERLGEDFARHPVQLYSALMNWLVFAVLITLYKKYRSSKPPMFFGFLYILLYFAGRFTVEFWKDLQGPLDLPITMGQLLSLLPIAIGIVGLLVQRARSK